MPPELLAIGMEPDAARAWCIFAPYQAQRMVSVIQSKTRFVHYTSAEVAMSILDDKSIWMRSAATMNDFSEIEHGTGLLKEVWASETGQRLQATLAGIFPEAIPKATKLYESWWTEFKNHTYITCLSEHFDFEDETGRLSMWRAYGGAAGVALVMNQTPIANASDALKAYTAPVAYFDTGKMGTLFEAIAQNVVDEQAYLQGQGEEALVGALFGLFRSTVIATKHPGFAEEAEWRVTYSPNMDESERIKPAIRSVRGAPQTIYRIPLESVPEEGLHGLDIPDLLDRIIVGPTEHGYAIAEAFARKLTELGVENAWERVHLSHIPLRNI